MNALLASLAVVLLLSAHVNAANTLTYSEWAGTGCSGSADGSATITADNTCQAATVGSTTRYVKATCASGVTSFTYCTGVGFVIGGGQSSKATGTGTCSSAGM
eukprot:GILK01011838.1.p1 GENE.GILK01011838.1~~GILK01011838.1.p1  ORF type:complete len:103 (+),score=9.14 GILK01011838.1:30-338(+)